MSIVRVSYYFVVLLNTMLCISKLKGCMEGNAKLLHNYPLSVPEYNLLLSNNFRNWQCWLPICLTQNSVNGKMTFTKGFGNFAARVRGSFLPVL
jgi:hypothetical protein